MDNSEVIYKDIPDFPGYKASSDGFIWSSWNRKSRGYNKGTESFIDNNKLKKLICSMDKSTGYYYVGLHKNGKCKTFKVHTLIFLAFNGQRPLNCVVAHNNGIKTDNRLENLRWASYKENSEDSIKHGTYSFGENHYYSKLKNEDVVNIRQMKKEGFSTREISNKYNIDISHIRDIIKYESWKHLL